MRTLTINGEEYLYSIGRQVIVIKSPRGKRHNVTIAEVLGLTPDAVERARAHWKHSNLANVKPSDLKQYIEANSI